MAWGGDELLIPEPFEVDEDFFTTESVLPPCLELQINEPSLESCDFTCSEQGPLDPADNSFLPPSIANFIHKFTDSIEDNEECSTSSISPFEFSDAEQIPSRNQQASKSRQRRPRKTKIYEINEPFEDFEKEKKRRNAVNAKRQRDMLKKNQMVLERELTVLQSERDHLKITAQVMRSKIDDLLRLHEKYESL